MSLEEELSTSPSSSETEWDEVETQTREEGKFELSDVIYGIFMKQILIFLISRLLPHLLLPPLET